MGGNKHVNKIIKAAMGGKTTPTGSPKVSQPKIQDSVKNMSEAAEAKKKADEAASAKCIEEVGEKSKRGRSSSGSASEAEGGHHRDKIRKNAEEEDMEANGEEDREVENTEDLEAEKEAIMHKLSSVLGSNDESKNIMDTISAYIKKAEDLAAAKHGGCSHLRPEDVEEVKDYVLRESLEDAIKDRELERLARTVCIQGLVPSKTRPKYQWDTLEDWLVDLVHEATNYRVSVHYCRLWRSAEDNKPKSATVVLGSVMQKEVLYRHIAAHMRNKTKLASDLYGLSFRDMIPRDYMEDATRMLRRGADLKRKGEILGYKVKAMGYYCLPALFVRTKQRSWHMIEKTKLRTEAEKQQAGGEEEEREEAGSGRQRQGAAGSSKKSKKPVPAWRKKTVAEEEDYLEKLRRNAQKDPAAYYAAIQDLQYKYYNEAQKFMISMEGTEWYKAREAREEEAFSEAY